VFVFKRIFLFRSPLLSTYLIISEFLLNQEFALENDNVRRGAAKASLASFAPAFGVVAVAAGDVVR